MLYCDVLAKMHDKSSVWCYFLRAKDNASAKCKTCHKIFKTLGGNTSGLHKHLKSIHNLILSKDEVRPAASTYYDCMSNITTTDKSKSEGELYKPPEKKSKMTDFFQRADGIEVKVSRMAALDGIPFRTFVESKDLRELFKKSQYTLPSSVASISNMVIKQADYIKSQTLIEIKKLKASGVKFSCTLDEWTSTQNKRYMNVNIHSTYFDGAKYKNLGLVKISGSMPAVICVDLLKKRLLEFDVHLDTDVISLTTDGCSVMKKMGKSVDAYHQKCLAHGIQLAILDVLYKKTKTVTVQNDVSQNNDDVSADDDNDDEKDENGSFEIIEISKSRKHEEVVYEHVINKVRNVAKLFRKSPTKQTVLKKYVEEDFHRELKLIIDCKTRWSSLAEMLERFLKLKICVRKALIDVGSGIDFTESEYSTLETISDSLNILKVTLEVLCRRDATLLTADTALNFCLQKLNSQQSSLSVSLANSLCIRIKENRLIEASILQYLHNPSQFFENKLDPRAFNTLNNDDITLSLKELYERLNKSTTESYTANSSDNDFNDITIAEPTSFTAKEQLACELENLLNPRKIEKQTSIHDLQTTLHVEKALFENGGDRGKHLNQCYNYLLSIPPTSVEAERAFSNAGYFCNKIRSSLSENTLNALCFLRAYYKNEKS